MALFLGLEACLSLHVQNAEWRVLRFSDALCHYFLNNFLIFYGHSVETSKAKQGGKGNYRISLRRYTFLLLFVDYLLIKQSKRYAQLCLLTSVLLYSPLACLALIARLMKSLLRTYWLGNFYKSDKLSWNELLNQFSNSCSDWVGRKRKGETRQAIEKFIDFGKAVLNRAGDEMSWQGSWTRILKKKSYFFGSGTHQKSFLLNLFRKGSQTLWLIYSIDGRVRGVERNKQMKNNLPTSL